MGEDLSKLSKEELIHKINTLYYNMDIDTNKIKELETKNKKLEEENEQLKLKERNRILGRYGEIEVHDLINKTLKDDYIPVSLVEETMEELIKEGRHYNASKIEVLQELLEKEK